MGIYEMQCSVCHGTFVAIRIKLGPAIDPTKLRPHGCMECAKFYAHQGISIVREFATSRGMDLDAPTETDTFETYVDRVLQGVDAEVLKSFETELHARCAAFRTPDVQLQTEHRKKRREELESLHKQNQDQALRDVELVRAVPLETLAAFERLIRRGAFDRCDILTYIKKTDEEIMADVPKPTTWFRGLKTNT